MQNINFLTVDDVIIIHEMQLRLYRGSPGIRDMNLLESAVNVVQSGYGETYFHETLPHMAAAYIFHIIQNHPFFDGNKRTGVVSGLTFLHFNDIDIQWTQGQMYKIGMKVANSELSKEELIKVIDQMTLTF